MHRYKLVLDPIFGDEMSSYSQHPIIDLNRPRRFHSPITASLPPPDPEILALHHWIYCISHAKGRAGDLSMKIWRRDEADEEELTELGGNEAAEAALQTKLRVAQLAGAEVEACG